MMALYSKLLAKDPSAKLSTFASLLLTTAGTTWALNLYERLLEMTLAINGIVRSTIEKFLSGPLLSAPTTVSSSLHTRHDNPTENELFGVAAKPSRQKWTGLVFGLACLFICFSFSFNSALARPAASTIDGPIEQLKPGEYLWAPQIAPDGPVVIIVSLTAQRGYVYRNGVPIGVTSVSTGKKGHETPTGVFTILQKDIDHRSNIYSDAPMPFMQRLTWSGVAMHAGNLPGYPASHGCVRLPQDFAEKLFSITHLGMTVVITNNPLVPEVVPSPSIFRPSGGNARTITAPYIWRPERSRTGPLSIVVSGRDRRIIVLRNGVEIGSSTIRIDGVVSATQAFTLRNVDEQGFHWLRLPLPTIRTIGSPEMTGQERARAHLPEPFRASLAAALTPGTTLLITRESLRTGGTGERLTVLRGDRH